MAQLRRDVLLEPLPHLGPEVRLLVGVVNIEVHVVPYSRVGPIRTLAAMSATKRLSAPSSRTSTLQAASPSWIASTLGTIVKGPRRPSVITAVPRCETRILTGGPSFALTAFR